MQKLTDFSINHEKTLVNLSSSILKHYGATYFHASIPEVDEVLSGHRKIAVFLLDGLGKAPLAAFPKAGKYLRDHSFLTIYSTNPATTAAATTAFLCGKYPIETGWMGWTCYIKEFNKGVNILPNRWADSHKPIEGWNYKDICPVDKIEDLLSSVGVKAKQLNPTNIDKDGYHPGNIEEMAEMTDKFFREGGEFLYIYNDMPDQLMHIHGVRGRKVSSAIKKLSEVVENFAENHPDVLVMVIADHGMRDVISCDIASLPNLTSLIERTFYLEGRTASFFVKEGKKEEFRKTFSRLFPNFILLSKEEILEKGYFGEGKPHPRSLDTIGDFIAISMKDELLGDSREGPLHFFRGHHAGGSREELEISLAIINS